MRNTLQDILEIRGKKSDGFLKLFIKHCKHMYACFLTYWFAACLKNFIKHNRNALYEKYPMVLKNSVFKYKIYSKFQTYNCLRLNILICRS